MCILGFFRSSIVRVVVGVNNSIPRFSPWPQGTEPSNGVAEINEEVEEYYVYFKIRKRGAMEDRYSVVVDLQGDFKQFQCLIFSIKFGLVEAVRRSRIQTYGKEDGGGMAGNSDRSGDSDCIFYTSPPCAVMEIVACLIIQHTLGRIVWLKEIESLMKNISISGSSKGGGG